MQRMEKKSATKRKLKQEKKGETNLSKLKIYREQDRDIIINFCSNGTP